MLAGNYMQLNDRYNYRKLHKDGKLFSHRYDKNSREEGIELFEPDLLPHYQYFDSLAARRIKLKYYGISSDAQSDATKNTTSKKRQTSKVQKKPLPKTTTTRAVINPRHVFSRRHKSMQSVSSSRIEEETEMQSLLGESFKGNLSRQKKYVGYVRSPSLPIIFESPKPIQHSTPYMFSPIGPPMPDLVSCTYQNVENSEHSAYDGLDTGVDSNADHKEIELTKTVNKFLKQFFLNYYLANL